MRNIIPVFIACSIALLACGTGVDPVDIIGEPVKGDDNFRTVDESVDVAWYSMILVGDGISGAMHLEDNDAKTVWKPEIGYIFLNTDEDAGDLEPIGTLEIRLPEGYQDRIRSSGTAIPEDMNVSKTDRRVGTAMELNGRLYEPSSTCELINVEVGYNYIHAVISCNMDRVLVWPDEEPETIEFMAEFVAKRK